jgi:hypothetical protein
MNTSSRLVWPAASGDVQICAMTTEHLLRAIGFVTGKTGKCEGYYHAQWKDFFIEEIESRGLAGIIQDLEKRYCYAQAALQDSNANIVNHKLTITGIREAIDKEERNSYIQHNEMCDITKMLVNAKAIPTQKSKLEEELKGAIRQSTLCRAKREDLLKRRRTLNENVQKALTDAAEADLKVYTLRSQLRSM